jgi:electron transfer flavoprotein-quinone oxidoreductase
MPENFDVVVVGAGPAGSAAALVAARGGLSVCLLERGPFPGSKNMYGGVTYARILDDLLPRWWEEAPVQRWITRRSTMVATGTQAVTVDVRADAWAAPPFNGATTYRAEFDAWLATKAVEAGTALVTSTTAVGLLRDERGAVTGVRTDRPDGDIGAKVVIACDGVNSFLAKEAGLYTKFSSEHFTLGAKEVLTLGKDEIDRRFGLVDRQGIDIEMIGVTRGIAGGGFLYTNLDTVAVGVVVNIDALARAKVRPEELVAGVKSHPAIAPYLRGADLHEYSAHLIPEGGFDAMPRLVTDGLLVAGDAGGFCLAAGLFLEGVNFAIGSGRAAAETAIAAVGRGDTSRSGLSDYRRKISQTFVLADHKKMRRAPELVLSERMQTQYADLICGVAQGLFTVTNPTPKPGLRAIFRGERKRHGVRLRSLVRDGITSLRTFG